MTDQEFVEMIVKEIVDNPGDVKTEKTIDDRGVLISLVLNPTDMGKIIGKGGRTVNSIRKLLHVYGAKTDERINLKIFEPDGGEVRMSEENGDAQDNKPESRHSHEQKADKDHVPDVEGVPEEVEEITPTKQDEKPDLDDVPTEVLV